MYRYAKIGHPAKRRASSFYRLVDRDQPGRAYHASPGLHGSVRDNFPSRASIFLLVLFE